MEFCGINDLVRVADMVEYDVVTVFVTEYFRIFGLVCDKEYGAIIL